MFYSTSSTIHFDHPDSFKYTIQTAGSFVEAEACISTTHPRWCSSNNIYSNREYTKRRCEQIPPTRRPVLAAEPSEALKFLPNHHVLPEGLSSPFLEYLSPRSTLAPPHPSPLAARLLSIDGITSIFYGPHFITVTKASDASWAHVKPEVFSLITEAVSSGEQIVNTIENKSAEGGQEGGERDTLEYNKYDSEVVGMIKELLETRIRPAIQEDGGDIEFRGFQDGNVLLKLRGACRTCDSSTVTLKNGIESMLMHYVSDALLLPQASCPH